MSMKGIAAGVLVGAAGWWYWQQQQGAGNITLDTTTITDAASSAADTAQQLVNTAADAIDQATGGIFGMVNIAYMSRVTPDMLNNRNIQALLKVIRSGEGTAGPNGYTTLFGGGQFAGYADHPNKTVCRGSLCSTAAGAYQLLYSTWKETQRALGLKDFSPANQDMAALARIAARNALDDALAGRFAAAIGKINKEWASMPGSPYGQPTINLSQAYGIYAAAGGVASDYVMA